MQAPDLPIDEPYRNQAIEALALLDTPPDPDFDGIVEIGRTLFGVPTCLITLIHGDRQWFKARAGLDGTETPRDLSFCGHAILGREVMVVPDARLDPRFHDNPFVTGDPFVRFYAGAPLALPNGYTIGTLCILSPEPRADFGAEDERRLAGLADLAVGAIGTRALRRALDEERRERERLLRAFEAVGEAVAVLETDGVVRAANAAFSELCDAYLAPGLSIFEHTSLTPDELGQALTSTNGACDLTLRTAGADREVTLHRDLDGFILVGSHRSG